MARAALKLVESHGFSVEELELPPRTGDAPVHSLHSLCSLPGDISPEIAEYCISRFSEPGDVVLDPLCGSGTVPLQAALTGRIAYASDINPLATQYTHAKLEPADIAEVALSLQLLNLSKPVGVSNFDDYFSPFYDINTYRELVNLKSYLSTFDNRTSKFISAATSSLLHGHGASCFSSYSFSAVSLSPREQRDLNGRRGQYPDYRSVQPRVLKKTAGVMRDGYPSKLRNGANEALIFQADVRDLSRVQNAQVDLVVTEPAMPNSEFNLDNLWLKLWFADISRSDLDNSYSAAQSVSDWLDFMNESAFELARVVKPGGRLAFVVGEGKLQDKEAYQLLIDTIEESLDKYWSAELHLKCKAPSPLVAGTESRSKKDVLGKHVVVFRRR